MDFLAFLFFYKNCLLINAAFFMFLLRISIKNLDRRLNRLERHFEKVN